MKEKNSRPRRKGRPKGESPRSFDRRMAIETQRLVDGNNDDATAAMGSTP